MRFLCPMKKILLIVVLHAWFLSNGQIKMMCYNVLNFPTGNLQGRVDTLEKIINYSRPRLMMIQELKNAQGLADITDMMNDIGYGDFAHSEFIPQQSPGSPGNLLQQAIVYDTEIFRMKNEGVVLTNYRDINEYVLYLNDPQLPAGADTTFLYVYVTHLKSSTGADNEQTRLEMVSYLLEHFSTLPENSHVIFTGDFNLYSTSEPAYLAMTAEDNDIVLRDPLASLGDWSVANFAHREILTQSTRLSQINNDGAGGGVDDRFDFILLSESLMNPDSDLHYVEGSTVSLGNTGLCYNQNITDCDLGNPVPPDVLRAIYYMSDHIPVCAELNTDIINTREEIVNSLPSMNAYFTSQNELSVQINNAGMSAEPRIRLVDITGRIIIEERINCSSCAMTIQTPEISSGAYVLMFADENGTHLTNKIALVR
jgi:exonuclease III